MKPEMKMGLVAGSIVFGLALAIGGVVWLASGGEEGPVPRGLPAGLRPANDPRSAADLTALVARHKFWRVKVTAADVGGLVGKIRGEKANTLVYIDDHFVYISFVDYSAETYRANAAILPPPSGLSKRHFQIDLFGYASRPEPALVLTHLLTALDRADFASD